MDILLETERLALRRFTLADAALALDLDSDPEVTHYITGGVSEFDLKMLDAWLDEYRRWPGYGTFAAVERSSGAFLGWFHLRPEEGSDDKPELGYRLRRDAWGRATPRRGLGLSWTRRSPTSAPRGCGPPRWPCTLPRDA